MQKSLVLHNKHKCICYYFFYINKASAVKLHHCFFIFFQQFLFNPFQHISLTKQVLHTLQLNINEQNISQTNMYQRIYHCSNEHKILNENLENDTSLAIHRSLQTTVFTCINKQLYFMVVFLINCLIRNEYNKQHEQRHVLKDC